MDRPDRPYAAAVCCTNAGGASAQEVMAAAGYSTPPKPWNFEHGFGGHKFGVRSAVGVVVGTACAQEEMSGRGSVSRGRGKGGGRGGGVPESASAEPPAATADTVRGRQRFLARLSSDAPAPAAKGKGGSSAAPAPSQNKGAAASAPAPTSGPAAWTVEQVGAWLDELGLGEYRATFKANHVTGYTLPLLSKELLKSELNVASLGHRLAITQAVSKLLPGEPAVLGGAAVPETLTSQLNGTANAVLSLRTELKREVAALRDALHEAKDVAKQAVKEAKEAAKGAKEAPRGKDGKAEAPAAIVTLAEALRKLEGDVDKLRSESAAADATLARSVKEALAAPPSGGSAPAKAPAAPPATGGKGRGKAGAEPAAEPLPKAEPKPKPEPKVVAVDPADLAADVSALSVKELRSLILKAGLNIKGCMDNYGDLDEAKLVERAAEAQRKLAAKAAAPGPQAKTKGKAEQAQKARSGPSASSPSSVQVSIVPTSSSTVLMQIGPSAPAAKAAKPNPSKQAQNKPTPGKPTNGKAKPTQATQAAAEQAPAKPAAPTVAPAVAAGAGTGALLATSIGVLSGSEVKFGFKLF